VDVISGARSFFTTSNILTFSIDRNKSGFIDSNRLRNRILISVAKEGCTDQSARG